DLVQRRAAVIFAISPPVVLAAKTAIKTIPIVFIINEDPVRLGLVASLARPGGNLTGVNFFAAELAAKRLEFLRELVPAATRVAVLLNPAEATLAASNLRDVSQREHQQRNRRGLRDLCARAARRTLHQQRPIFQQPAGPIGPSGDATCSPHDTRV